MPASHVLAPHDDLAPRPQRLDQSRGPHGWRRDCGGLPA
jgi:hypothetical protein